jgi:8-amino-7-oxononanoate synthase
LRKLKNSFPEIDFCSNDYLGFSRLGLLQKKFESNGTHLTSFGSTGSRLMSGNSQFVEEAEKQIALFHHGKSALIFNSGYDANIGLLSSVAQRTDLILYDELVHASIQDGIKLSAATHYKFRHNDLHSVEELIARHQKNFENIYVVVESVYALDGDSAPLLELSELCKPSKNLFLIVDEAHAIGVFGSQGRGLCNAMVIEQHCFARIYTYGKAMGCQGAAVVGSHILTNYLVNFARSFIYTTALPEHSIEAILHAYQLLIETNEKDKLQKNIAYFYSKTTSLRNCIKSQSGIHSLLVGSNEQADKLEQALAAKNIHVRTMKSPTVRHATERVRISLHSYNTKEEIDTLVEVLNEFR